MKANFSRKLSFLVKKLLRNYNSYNNEQLITQGILSVGVGTYGDFRVDHYKGSDSKVVIGKYCSISNGVILINGGIHPLDWPALYPIEQRIFNQNEFNGMPSTKGDIIIEDDVWIGTNAIILSGVKIGTGSIVGAGTVVSRDVPAYSICLGNPGKIIRQRFNDDTIAKLKKIDWTNLNPTDLEIYREFLQSPIK